MLRFPYQELHFAGPPPPCLPQNALGRWRPLVPVTIIGTGQQSVRFLRALVDPGADDTIFPLGVAATIGATLRPATRHAMRWQGVRYALRYGDVELELIDDDGIAIKWRSIVAFTQASVRYPVLGICGCLEFFSARFLGADRIIELEPNGSCPIA